jgi:hypothetical protein
MLHRFTCGLEFVIVPKEIPLSDLSEPVVAKLREESPAVNRKVILPNVPLGPRPSVGLTWHWHGLLLTLC